MRVFPCIIVSLFILACSPERDQSLTVENNCKDILISNSLYQSLDPFQLGVIDAEIVDDCLKMTLGVSGCDVNHEVDMITDGGVQESLPLQIEFDFRDNDIQACQAYYQIKREFDLSPIRTTLSVEEDIILNFRNSDINVLYK